MDSPEQVKSSWGNVGTFLALTALFSAVFYTAILASGHLGGASGMYVMGLMWCPAFAAFATCRIRGISIATLGWHWGGFKFQAASYLVPPAYALVAYVVIWSTGFGSFPSKEFVDGCVKAVGFPSLAPWIATVIMIVLTAVYGFIKSCASALGEEIGWRGFLVPQMMAARGFAASSLLTGIIWASWHYGAILGADYNNGGLPRWYALTCFTVMVIAISVVFTWFRLRTGSLWTGVFLHGSHNLFIQAIFTPITGDTGRTKYAVDEFGFAVPLMTVLVAIWFWTKRDVAIRAWTERRAAGNAG
jgi:membrane protease YdiL (CAAX protease family)